jgi:alcohol dehydrogenase (NADP+)
MESLVTDGLVKSIGVSNYTAILLQDLLNYAKIKPVLNQVEITPHLPQNGLVDFCKANDVLVVAYGSLGRPGQHQLPVNLLEDEIVSSIAKKLTSTSGKTITPAHVLLAWALQRGIAVIPKAAKLERMRSNLEAQSVSLSPQHMDAMKKLDINLRYSNPALHGSVSFAPRGPVLYE